MAVIDRIALGVADSMRVVTGRTRSLRILYMFFMLRKTLVPQYTISAVAFIAQGVGGRVFFCKIKGYIVSLKEKLETGAMGTLRPQGVIVVVAVRAGNQTPYGIGAQKTWHLEIHSC